LSFALCPAVATGRRYSKSDLDESEIIKPWMDTVPIKALAPILSDGKVRTARRQ